MAQFFSNIQSIFSPNFFKFKFVQDILKTFIGVFLAFWVGEWTSSRDSKVKENYLLQEIQHELHLNIDDLRTNLGGHQQGIEAAKTFQFYLQNSTSDFDSLNFYFYFLLRDFISIQHTAAYETLKTRGMESIMDDSLRLHIADLYDFEFEAVEKLEEQYYPHEFFEIYNQPMLQILTKCFDFSKKKGENRQIMPLSKLPKQEQNLMHAWLKKIIADRAFSISSYQEAIKKGEKVLEEIKKSK